MPSYLDSGYNEFITKETPIDSSSTKEVDPLQFDQSNTEVSGSKIRGGLTLSKSGKIIFDLENDMLKFSNGAIDRFLIGKLEDGTIGMLVRNDEGSEICRINSDGFNFKKGKFNFQNDSGQDLFTNKGLVANKFIETNTITKKTAETRVDGGITPINEFNVSFKTASTCFGIFIASISYNTNNTDLGVRFRYRIDNYPFPYTTDQTSWVGLSTEVAGTESFFQTLTTFNSFAPGVHSVQVEAGAGGTGTMNIFGISTGDTPCTFTYCLFGRTD